MKDITTHIRKRLAMKNMSHAGIGAFCVEIAKTFAKDPEVLHGYIRHYQLFLTLSPKEDKTKRFLEKKKILSIINQRLEVFGYEYVVRDVRIK